MHGPLGRYRGKYPEAALQRLSEEILSLREGGRELYCYFNNDMEGFAWENARELEALLGEAGG